MDEETKFSLYKRPTRALTHTLRQKVDANLLSHVYQQLTLGQFTSLFCATVIFYDLFNTAIAMPTLIAWYVYFFAVCVARFVLGKMYQRYHLKTDLTLWRNLFAIGAFLGGCGWGLAGSVLFVHADDSQRILIVLVLAGITSGASPLLAAELRSAMLFLCAALLPLIFQLHELGQTAGYATYAVFDVTVSAYIVYLAVLLVKLNQVIKNSITLRFENDALVDNLSRTKEQLEAVNEKLIHAATHDPLTKLANRSLFNSTLQNAISHARIHHKIVALMFIDLDNFKEVNDEYGHHVGDNLLLKIAERLQDNIRESDFMARLGGDEFIIILENIDDISVVISTVKQLCHVLSEPFDVTPVPVTVTVSIGISVYPVDGADVASLLRSADKAMYFVKEHGRNSFNFSSDVSELKKRLNSPSEI